MGDWLTSKHPEPGRYNNTMYGVFIGALIVVLVWAMFTVMRGSAGSPSASQPRQATDAGTAAAIASDDSAPSEAGADPAKAWLNRCQLVYAEQQRPLRAAGVAMSQWQVHIYAMNKLVLGAITLQQANQFWNQTRAGARAHLRAFIAARRHFDGRTVHCRPVGSGPHGRQLGRCERAVAARNGVLDTARAALATWGMHVRHMEMLRDGMMSPARAQRLWLENWHEGQHEVNQYRSAEHDARTVSC